MGFFFRKSINLGIFRVNFSKKGVGVSTGVKGARVSWGPTGKYLSVGRNGIYYRKKLDSKPKNPVLSDPSFSNEPRPILASQELDATNNMKYLKIFGIIPSLIIIGFVTFKCFEVINTIETRQDIASISGEVVNIRSNPSKSAEIVLKARKEQKFTFVGQTNDGWSKILVNGDIAFVSSDLVTVANELTDSATIRRYDDNRQMRALWIGLTMLPLLFWNLFLYRVDRRNHAKTFNIEQDKKLRALVSDADTLRESEKYRDAVSLYKEAILINPEYVEAFFGIASCYFNLKNDEEAIAYYKKGLAIEPNNIHGTFNLAHTYYYAGQDTTSIKMFQKVLELDNSNSRAHYFLAMLQKENQSQAIIHLEQALLGDLKDVEKKTAQKVLQMSYIIEGTVNNQNDDIIKAKYSFNRALDFGSIQDNKKAYEVAGDHLKNHKMDDLAIRYYDLISDYVPRPTIIKPKTVNNQPTSKFRKEYFDLLVEFQSSLSIISAQLYSDERFVEKLKEGVTNYGNDFIDGCILYDCYQTVKMLSNDRFDKSSLETFGLVQLAPVLLKTQNTLTQGYQPNANLFDNKKFTAMADAISDLAGGGNPLQISEEELDNDIVLSSEKFQSVFCLPTALKILDSQYFDEYASLLYRFANIIAKADNAVTKEEEDALKRIFAATHKPIPEKPNNSLNIITAEKNETLDQILSELDSLIGLDSVKNEVKSLINYIKVQKEREKLGLKSTQVSYHCVLTGSPGTGKTTIARIVAKIYLHLGVLKKGHLVETDRSGLIAEYTGQTAVKVNKTVDSAIDGVLFIDEAYALVGEGQDNYGREAVATLIKRIEDDRDKLVVILAGYTKEMKDFIETNPGFKSRFNRFIEFEDYTSAEMDAIFKLSCKKLEYKLTSEAESRLISLLESAHQTRGVSFGNGRFVRNTFEKTIERQANRIASYSEISKEILTTIIPEDIPESEVIEAVN